MTDDAPDAGREVTWERRGSVGVVAINRPDRMNAVTPPMGQMLLDGFRALEGDPEVRSVILTGAGRSFCSGADVKAGIADPEAVLRDTWNPLIETMTSLRIPIIAAINGVAAGAGASLALASDLRVADGTARIQLSFVKVGLLPDTGATWLLPRLIGLGRANELAMLGGDVSASDALAWGLVNRVCDDGAAVPAAEEIARRFEGLPSSVAAVKAAHHRGLSTDLSDQLVHEASEQGRLRNHPDFDEAMAAFREKRRPEFAPRTPTLG
ncbi:enoyl-CoA hydratase-related protein [Actinomycetospora endophytica]|uniref:Enoyl-CoA hydratase-related protein n=1 Tax=Actinomycetospora endophytica TaxID=2291215 RepID=A0ABS8PBY8_9PSEU|nr:enoyl-CoA hydratase-related protein [Actinomycetospora endophytica]MCD2195809.1 enoyl-CoA hydratase-related protein [Actinomycetospora endophytica]